MRITKEQFEEVIIDSLDYITKLLSASDSIGSLMYEQVIEDTGTILEQYFQGNSQFLQSLLMTVQDAMEHNPAQANEVVSALTDYTKKMMELQGVMQALDLTRLGDIIKYEIPQELERLNVGLKGLLQ